MDIGKAENDISRENEGEWVDLEPWGFPGIRAHVLSEKSKTFENTIRKYTVAMRVELARGGAAAMEANQKINRRAIVSCVKDVDGFTKDGAPYPYAELRKRLLSDDADEVARLKDLRFALSAAIGSVGTVDRLVVEEAGKEPAEPSEPD